MDVNIICPNENYYFKLGIAHIIREAVLCDATLHFLTGAGSDTLQKADIIIVNISQWRLFMCQPAYRYRKAGSVLLVFADGDDSFTIENLPICYRAMTVVARGESVRRVTKKIAQAWMRAQDEELPPYLPTDCLRCSYTRLSLVQLQVLSFLKSGRSVRQIAHCLGLSIKTVYAHKYNVMHKFDLRGEHQFHSFLNDLSLIELYKGVVTDQDR